MTNLRKVTPSQFGVHAANNCDSPFVQSLRRNRGSLRACYPNRRRRGSTGVTFIHMVEASKQVSGARGGGGGGAGGGAGGP